VGGGLEPPAVPHASRPLFFFLCFAPRSSDPEGRALMRISPTGRLVFFLLSVGPASGLHSRGCPPTVRPIFPSSSQRDYLQSTSAHASRQEPRRPSDFIELFEQATALPLFWLG